VANALTNLTPQLGLQILEVFRENSIMPMLVNNDFDTSPAVKGQTIDINVMSDMETRDVSPGMTNTATGLADVASVNYPLTLSNWRETAFVMTDKELQEVADGTRSKAIEKAVQALANYIDLSILNLYQKVYQFTGTAGTSPFGTSLLEAQNASRILSTNKAPKDQNRFMVLDEFGYANALGNETLQKVSYAGNAETLREGMISRVLGFNWYEDQNIPTHTVGASGNYAIDAAGSTGATSIVVDNAGGAAPTSPAVGDIFSIAGSDQTYVVTSVTSGAPTANEATLGISPALDQDVADGDLVTFQVTASHTANMAFYREAFAFASRPLADVPTPGSTIETLPDPVSGVNLRLEIQRVHKQTVFSVDCLWGVAAPYANMAVRILG